MIKVYVAGPYTKGDVAQNVAKAIRAANDLVNLGFYPFVPHLTHFWHLICERPYEDWLRLDLAWIEDCHVILRLPGESSGADGEERFAAKKGIPVVHSIEELLEMFGARR